MSFKSNIERLSLFTFMKKMGFESASALETIGGSISRGNNPNERDTRSRTSLAAVSKSTPKSNSTVMLLRPSRLADVRVLIPEIPLIDSSNGSVIWDSIISALAPV